MKVLSQTTSVQEHLCELLEITQKETKTPTVQCQPPYHVAVSYMNFFVQLLLPLICFFSVLQTLRPVQQLLQSEGSGGCPVPPVVCLQQQASESED